jgi:hypothetical protein
MMGANYKGPKQTYPLEPHLALKDGLLFSKQLTSQQSPPSQPHSAVLAAPLLHRPLPNTKGRALQTAGVGLKVGSDVGLAVNTLDGANVGAPVGAGLGKTEGESRDGSKQTYPLEPHLALKDGLLFCKQLTSQQSPPSQPHSAVLAAPLLHRPLDKKEGFAEQIEIADGM